MPIVHAVKKLFVKRQPRKLWTRKLRPTFLSTILFWPLSTCNCWRMKLIKNCNVYN